MNSDTFRQATNLRNSIDSVSADIAEWKDFDKFLLPVCRHIDNESINAIKYIALSSLQRKLVELEAEFSVL